MKTSTVEWLLYGFGFVSGSTGIFLALTGTDLAIPFLFGGFIAISAGAAVGCDQNEKKEEENMLKSKDSNKCVVCGEQIDVDNGDIKIGFPCPGEEKTQSLVNALNKAIEVDEELENAVKNSQQVSMHGECDPFFNHEIKTTGE